MDYLLVVSRALQFTATILMTGVLFFRALIADPSGLSSAKVDVEHQGERRCDYQLRLMLWIGFLLAFASGAAWFLAVSGAIEDGPIRQAIADGTATTVLTETQFGRVWIVRIVVGVLLAAVVGTAKLQWMGRRSFELSLAAVFAGSLAFVGHAASVPGLKGDIHLASDALHLIAVCAWVGSLVPYALYLKAISEDSRASIKAQEATRRFSNLGFVAVLTIATTGIINTYNLVGSTDLLTQTQYGQLLLIKVALFIAMIGVAAINRFWLTPRLSDRDTTKHLRRNSLIETCFGLLIVCIVAVLGTMPPAMLEHEAVWH
ncbi:MAG TPA: copper homeostasis membrane protein CopD [Schlesneria sp.]